MPAFFVAFVSLCLCVYYRLLIELNSFGLKAHSYALIVEETRHGTSDSFG